jgi:hypothetical protein
MKSIRLKSLIMMMIVVMAGCKSGLPENYRMEKRYWDVDDYSAALRQMRFLSPREEGYPRLSDPVTAPVFLKLVDTENVDVILMDTELGIKHRSEVATSFFEKAKEMTDVYREIDQQDKFIYSRELVEVIRFSLHTQLLYFKLGNEKIQKDAIDPSASDIRKILRENAQIIVGNFKIHIDFLNKEDAFDDVSLKEYAKVIDDYYARLMIEFPEANYDVLKKSAEVIGNKMMNNDIKTSLRRLIDRINEKSSANNVESTS